MVGALIIYGTIVLVGAILVGIITCMDKYHPTIENFFEGFLLTLEIGLALLLIFGPIVVVIKRNPSTQTIEVKEETLKKSRKKRNNNRYFRMGNCIRRHYLGQNIRVIKG